jgi:hypothetical protein
MYRMFEAQHRGRGLETIAVDVLFASMVCIAIRALAPHCLIGACYELRVLGVWVKVKGIVGSHLYAWSLAASPRNHGRASVQTLAQTSCYRRILLGGGGWGVGCAVQGAG